MKEFNIKTGFHIGKTTWLGIGGVCEYFFKPKSKEELTKFFKTQNTKITILGNTSNVMIKEDGVKGTTIRLAGSFTQIHNLDDTLIEVGAGMLDKNFAFIMAEEGISGFEFLSTIPGTIGGGIKMNCGCFGGEIADNFVSLKGLTFKGDEITLTANDVKFNYRKAEIPDNIIVTSVILKGVKSTKDKILKKMLENQQKRSESQPSGGKTLGSTFKNTQTKKAWELLDISGLRGVKIGGASFSDKHLNFLINDGSATYGDVSSLIRLAQNLVYEKCGVRLELEIKQI